MRVKGEKERLQMDECKFELAPLNCGWCGAFIGVLGTCEDYAVCDRCQSQDLKDYERGARRGHDLVYSPQFEKGKPPMRVAKIPLEGK